MSNTNKQLNVQICLTTNDKLLNRVAALHRPHLCTCQMYIYQTHIYSLSYIKPFMTKLSHQEAAALHRPSPV